MDSKDGHEVDFRRDVNPNAVYELTALLGEGSYGAVYRGRSRIGNDLNEVAIKIIPDADDDLTALWREIRFLQVLRSPFVVSFIESLLFDNELWLVMELCDGGSLHDLKEAMKTTFNEKQLKVIIAFSVLGLAHLHSQMSIHRDVKSGNILITKDGRAKLGDFGISAQLTDTIMKRRTVIGSPYWMAPEVIQETSYDSKADIWSLGITLLELCEGNPPHFNVHPMRAIFIISSRAAPTLKDESKWSAEMVSFVSRCLVKDCDDRAASDELLKHPWIRQTVKEIGPRCNGSPLLQDLISHNWNEIERIRASKFKLPDNNSDGHDAASNQINKDLTLPRDAYHGNNNNMGSQSDDNTRTLERGARIDSNGGSYRSHDGMSAGDAGTFVRGAVGGGHMNMSDNMGTLVRGVSGGSGGSGGFDSGTLVRGASGSLFDTLGGGIPATRQQVRNATLSRSSTPTVTRRFNDMSLNTLSADNGGTYVRVAPSSGADRRGSDREERSEVDAPIRSNRPSDIQSALKYFRDDGPNPTSSSAETTPDQHSKYSNNNNSNNKQSSSSADKESSERQAEEFKKLIMKQLSALKKQYRDDLEELTAAYERKRRGLKEALSLMGTTGGGGGEGV